MNGQPNGGETGTADVGTESSASLRIARLVLLPAGELPISSGVATTSAPFKGSADAPTSIRRSGHLTHLIAASQPLDLEHGVQLNAVEL